MSSFTRERIGHAKRHAGTSTGVGVGRSRADIVFDVFNYSFLCIVFFIVAYPLYFIVIASVSNPSLVTLGEVWWFPKGFNLLGYARVFQEPRIWTGYRNSGTYTVLGVLVSLSLTLPAAYALSRRDLPGRRALTLFTVFTMLFNGGMISTFIIVTRTLQMENTLWAMILPTAMSTYHLIIARTFMESNIPMELHEAASIDGCSDFRFFFQMVLPLSGALIATLVLMFGVMRWNSFFDALLYLTQQKRFPLQVILRELLVQESMANDTSAGTTAIAQRQMADLIKYSIIIVSNIPVIVAYPFIQRFLVKGVLIGAIKG